MAMKNTKKNAPVLDSSEAISAGDIKNFLYWKAMQLIVLGNKARLCILSIKKYLTFPDTSKATIDLAALFKNMLEDIQKFPQEIGLSEMEAAEYEFSIELLGNEDASFAIVAQKYSKQDDTDLKDLCDMTSKNIDKIKIHERQSLAILSQACYLLGLRYIVEINTCEKEDMRRFALLEHHLRDSTCEAIGYWSAKLKTMQQNQKNVRKRTTTKDNHKVQIVEWMKTMKPKDVRLLAQEKLDVTERTVLKYMQEIRDEQTAFVRNKDDTA
jgi:hypothetical protein